MNSTSIDTSNPGLSRSVSSSNTPPALPPSVPSLQPSIPPQQQKYPGIQNYQSSHKYSLSHMPVPVFQESSSQQSYTGFAIAPPPASQPAKQSGFSNQTHQNQANPFDDKHAEYLQAAAGLPPPPLPSRPSNQNSTSAYRSANSTLQTSSSSSFLNPGNPAESAMNRSRQNSVTPQVPLIPQHYQVTTQNVGSQHQRKPPMPVMNSGNSSATINSQPPKIQNPFEDVNQWSK